MATLYQTLVNQGVAGGNTYSVQNQLYNKLGSPLGPYRGTYDQNIWLMNQMGGKNYNEILNPAPTAPPPQSQPSYQAPQQQQNPQIDVNKAIEDSFQKLQNEMVTKYQAYKSSNPFNLDQVLQAKTQEAKEQIDPYYNEKLSNYLTGVSRKVERSTDDAKDLMDQLGADTESYTEGSKLKLNEAISNSQQGFDNSGNFNSGERYRSQGLLQAGTGNDLADFNRNQDFKAKGIDNSLSRTLEDAASAKTQDVRDLERSRTTDINTRANDLTKEAGQSYVTGFKATLPTELQANSGFDILKDIGIYS